MRFLLCFLMCSSPQWWIMRWLKGSCKRWAFSRVYPRMWLIQLWMQWWLPQHWVELLGKHWYHKWQVCSLHFWWRCCWLVPNQVQGWFCYPIVQGWCKDHSTIRPIWSRSRSKRHLDIWICPNGILGLPRLLHIFIWCLQAFTRRYVLSSSKILCINFFHTGLAGGHAVRVVGWGVDSQSGLPYWTVANSWGEEWGMNGYFNFLRGSNECDCESQLYSARPLIH